MKYNTITVDPPWPISMAGKNIRRPNQAENLKYKTMSLSEIYKIPISEIANKGAHIYLWTTNKYLRESFNILDSWGVNYHLTLAWTKHNGMTPCFAYKFATEFVLLGFYGKPMVKFTGAGKLNWLHTNMQKKHSAKPDEWYELFSDMSPSPRIELFARKYRTGWDAWGDEIESSIFFMGTKGLERMDARNYEQKDLFTAIEPSSLAQK